jgi:predicted ATPase
MISPKLKTIQFDFSKLNNKEKYIKNIPPFTNTTELELNNKITYFVGENGS